jgi:hypothetical protein
MIAIGQDLTAETNGAVIKMLSCGVEYRNRRPPNVLWNPEIRNVVLVDFERSEILKQVSVLQETSPNRKRKHLHLSAPRTILACKSIRKNRGLGAHQKKTPNLTNLKLTTYNKPPCLYCALVKCYRA